MTIKLFYDQIKEPVTQSVTERRERHLQLVLINTTRVVSVERAETPLPVVDVLPERGELLEVDRRRVVLVEYA